MKKIIAPAIIIILLLSLACASKGPAPDEKDDLIQVTDIDEDLNFTLLNAVLQSYRDFDGMDVVPPAGWAFAERFDGDDFFGSKEEEVRFGIVLVNDETEEIIIAFRGTSTFLEGLDDADAVGEAFVPYNYGAALPEKLQVHTGFNRIYQSMQEELFAILDAYSNHRIYITGHSLGSSVATLFVFDAALSRPELDVFSYNYASPRVGNDTFARFFETLPGQVEAPLVRIVNSKDLIPDLPLQAEGYEHIARYFSLCFYQDDAPGEILPRHDADNYYTALLHHYGATMEDYPCALYRPNLPGLGYCE